MNDVMPTSKLNPIGLILCLCCASTLAYSSQKEMTQQQLSAVKKKLNQLETVIHQQVNSREQAAQHLASTEKEIGEQVKSLHEIQQTISIKKQAITNINTELFALKEKFQAQQKVLMTHLRLRYTIDTPHPIATILQTEKPNQISRLMTYYHYLIVHDKKLLQALQQTHLGIEKRQQALNQELAQLNALEKKIATQYQTLAIHKSKHQKLIQELTQHIQSKQQEFQTTKQDQARLEALLEQLSRTAFVPLKKNREQINSQTRTLSTRFQSPLQGQQRVGKAYNQGILFSAKEGTPVTSILPGKVIFSDWLNGYGLLLIIDHGNGMMSLYAHNESLFKKKGMMVNSGEEIATVGHTGGIRENGLYFELRQRGKVIPPRQWLT